MPLVERHQPHTLAALGHPVALVGVIAAEKVDFLHPVHVHDVLHQCRCEYGTRRQAVLPLHISQLVDIGLAAMHKPDLRSQRLISQPQHPQAQPAFVRRGVHEPRHEARARLRLLPALGVDRLVCGQCDIQAGCVARVDLDAPGPSVVQSAPPTLHTVPKGRRTLLPVHAKPAVRHRLIPVTEAEKSIRPVARGAQTIFQPGQPRAVGLQRLQTKHSPPRQLSQRLNRRPPLRGREIMDSFN